ncbi:hypothetical protein [Ruminobacter sp. RM87]|uniref:hypothetical protein n=1 Tax=Ruminobacter sp. RM87 TaxID=1200567 RepID=UPI0004E148BC|nr:hypothetical protein [Ruminobacter sp. RM87]
MFKNSPQKSSSIMDIAHAYGLGWECSRNRYIAQRNIYGEVNRNKSKNVTTKDIERAFMKGWACELGCACAEREQTISTINKVNLNKSSGVFLNNENDTIEYSSYFSDGIAEDRFVTLYTKTGRPYPYFFDDLSEEEKAVLDKKPVIGGRYDYVKYCTDGSLYDVHHIISAEALSATGLLSYNTAPCIRMLKSDHLDTKSYGRYKSSADYRKKQIELIQQGRIKYVIIEEINTIRSLFGSRYDREIKEMLKFVNKLEDNNWEV